jgi:4'-phosphopantetheinyl transferase
VHVSVSHSGDWVLVALCVDAPVGVDVEEVTARHDSAALANRALALDERAALGALPAADQPAAFARYWCRKEAVLKLTGDGLRHEPAGLRVSEPWAPPAVRSWTAHPDRVGGIQLVDLTIDARHEACTAYEATAVHRVVVEPAAKLFDSVARA